jgi:hypothetical protein
LLYCLVNIFTGVELIILLNLLLFRSASEQTVWTKSTNIACTSVLPLKDKARSPHWAAR